MRKTLTPPNEILNPTLGISCVMRTESMSLKV